MASHPVSAVQAVLHDSDELLVAQFAVVVLVEDLKDGVDQVVAQLDPSGNVNRPGEFIWEKQKRAIIKCLLQNKEALTPQNKLLEQDKTSNLSFYAFPFFCISISEAHWNESNILEVSEDFWDFWIQSAEC